MSRTVTLGRSLLGAAAIAAAALGFAGSALAKAVPIAWDPAYGSPFPSLGWRGDGVANYAAGCESLTGWVTNANACSAGSFSLTDLTLSFYDLDDPSDILDVITLTSPVVYEMYFQGGGLKGISTGFIAPVTSTLPIAELDGTTPVWWHMTFEKELSPVGTPSVQLYWTADYVDPICLFTKTCEGGQSENKAILTVVPEPGTYALMLGGLVAVGVVARRRKQ